jgi:hypothetical protein
MMAGARSSCRLIRSLDKRPILHERIALLDAKYKIKSLPSFTQCAKGRYR